MICRGATEAESGPKSGDILVAIEILHEWDDDSEDDDSDADDEKMFRLVYGDWLLGLLDDHGLEYLRNQWEQQIRRSDDTNFLLFSSGVNFMFNDPRVACAFGVRELLEEAMARYAEDVSMCLAVSFSSILRKHPDLECFNHLLTLPGVQRCSQWLFGLLLGTEYPPVFVYDSWAESLHMLRSLLEKDIVDVNATSDSMGRTALHELCGAKAWVERRNKFRFPRIKLLVKHSADTRMADNQGKLPIDFLLSTIPAGDMELPEVKEMLALLEVERDNE